MDGILVIDKPSGITSHDVVARCRRILKTKRIGHTGTLDPFATGVMVILVGKATRLAQFLDKDVKEYVAQVRFGFETDTGDLTGSAKSEAQSAKFVSEDAIEKVLPKFRGEIIQTPPMYSAKKIAGKKLYELARQGIEIERQAVSVKIHELDLVQSASSVQSAKCKVQSSESEYSIDDQTLTSDNRQPTTNNQPLTTDHYLNVICSAGTYIRTLAEDIGRELNVGAHLAALRRTRAGKFDLSQCVTLEKLEEIVAENNLDKTLISMNEALGHLPEIKLDADAIKKVQNGMKLPVESERTDLDKPIRLNDERENLIAIGFYNQTEKTIQPKIVLV